MSSRSGHPDDLRHGGVEGWVMICGREAWRCGGSGDDLRQGGVEAVMRICGSYGMGGIVGGEQKLGGER